MDILTQCVLPELVRHLRFNFFINPAKQDIKPLMQVLSWSEFVPEMLMTKVITSEFFPKWYKILAMWLKSGEESGNEPNYSEIASWYKSWKDTLKDIKGLDDYWKQGLDMMNQGSSCKIPIINSLSDDQTLLSTAKGIYHQFQIYLYHFNFIIIFSFFFFQFIYLFFFSLLKFQLCSFSFNE